MGASFLSKRKAAPKERRGATNSKFGERRVLLKEIPTPGAFIFDKEKLIFSLFIILYMYKEKIGDRVYFADVVSEGPFNKSFLKLWWNKGEEEVSLLLYPNGGLEYIVKDFKESESVNGVYKQMLSSLSEVATGNKTGIGVWKGGRIRFSYWVTEEGIFFADENSDDVKKFTIKKILENLNGLKPTDVGHIDGEKFEETFLRVMSSYDKDPCPFRIQGGVCFVDGERCNYYRKFVLYGWTCPKYQTDFELEKKLFGE